MEDYIQLLDHTLNNAYNSIMRIWMLDDDDDDVENDDELARDYITQIGEIGIAFVLYNTALNDLDIDIPETIRQKYAFLVLLVGDLGTFDFVGEDEFVDVPKSVYTKEEIDAYTISGVRSSVKSKFDQSTCAICLEDFKKKDKVRQLGCVHIFHDKCVLKWLNEEKTCPLCKTDISKKRKEPEKENKVELRQSKRLRGLPP